VGCVGTVSDTTTVTVTVTVTTQLESQNAAMCVNYDDTVQRSGVAACDLHLNSTCVLLDALLLPFSLASFLFFSL
jgi:uncharacterized protein YceK